MIVWFKIKNSYTWNQLITFIKGDKKMTKIKNNATQQLNKFVVEHFEATETNSSANTINQFAELVLGWFNETLTENE